MSFLVHFIYPHTEPDHFFISCLLWMSIIFVAMVAKQVNVIQTKANMEYKRMITIVCYAVDLNIDDSFWSVGLLIVHLRQFRSV